MAAPVRAPLLDHIAALSDPRQHAKVLYPLPEILLLVLAATIAGADDFVETTLWGTEHLAFLRRFYRYNNGIPSHDTLCDVFAAPDPELLKSCFLAWINDLRDDDPDIIAVDGKTSRRSHDRRKGRNPLHLVSAWAARQRVVLGQQATEEKSNEITAIPLLLKHLDLKGALVTMDAMGTQTDIARAIRDGGGDYCMSLKKNWPAVCADVEQLFTHPPDDVTFENTGDGGPDGRADRNRGRAKWKDRARDTLLSVFDRSLCSDLRPCRASALGVENRLHWVLDLIFREDLARFRTGDGPQNMAIIRHTAPHDWHTALVPALLALHNRPRPPTVLTIHNLAYQGNFPLHAASEAGLPAELLRIGMAEFQGQISFLKAGICAADRLTTVSRATPGKS